MQNIDPHNLAFYDGVLYQRRYLRLSFHDLFLDCAIDPNLPMYSDDIYVANKGTLSFKSRITNNLDFDRFIAKLEENPFADLFFEQYEVTPEGIFSLSEYNKIQYNDSVEMLEPVPEDDPDYKYLLAAYNNNVYYDLYGNQLGMDGEPLR